MSVYINLCVHLLQPLAWWPTWQRLLKITPSSWSPGSCRTASTASSQSLLSRLNTLALGRRSARWRSMQRTSWPERCLTATYCIKPSPSVFLTELLYFPCQDYRCVHVLNDFVCLGRSWHLVPCDSQSLGDNSIVSTHHPLRRAPCSLLECAHISRSWSATTLHCLSIRGVCLHLWWRGTDSLHYGPHARIRCGL